MMCIQYNATILSHFVLGSAKFYRVSFVYSLYPGINSALEFVLQEILLSTNLYFTSYYSVAVTNQHIRGNKPKKDFYLGLRVQWDKNPSWQETL